MSQSLNDSLFFQKHKTLKPKPDSKLGPIEFLDDLCSNKTMLKVTYYQTADFKE